MKLRTLYYSYARSFDRSFLKQVILIFDELWFSDPMERAVRQSIMYYNLRTGETGHKMWDSIKDDYEFLAEKGIFKIFDPCPLVREYDGLMAQAMLCDMQDEAFMRLASETASQDYWGIFRERVPPESLLAEALSFYGTRFWETPHSIKSPMPTDEFHKKGYGSYQDFSSPYIMAVEHDFIPVSCGYSVNINHALLISESNDLALLTDDINALALLNLKYARAKSLAQDAPVPSPLIARRTPEYLQKYSLLSINVIESLLPNDDLDRRSFQELIRFKESNRETVDRFRSYLFELTSQIDSEPWSPVLEKDILSLIDTKVMPEVMNVRDDLRAAYEKMFGSIVKNITATLTPTLIASVLTGLSSGQILTLSTAAVAGALSITIPEIVELWQDRRKIKRNGLSFLLKLK
ncbi:MAG: hypothetical protein M5U01_00375 [Ardenticatenaceae bacterium]|nr:hypothetical protein [Ardenticatenaceae bacterium]